ncbi:MAG: acetyl-CoA acetyltransferase [Chloroflexi bacterium]|nr:acetyl-CoA acetyltransferase [Chloroflexota bacterium]MBM3182661.1 acetyl-CoA acetyltransferase [Chloroflexota bacterium]MBM4453269.1 acetyl-CoA acetyltransferase [Chloroflexota bacterium]
MISSRVAIIGIGYTPFRTISPDVSFKEMMFEAAFKAYEDAGVNPRHDIDSFVDCAEDFTEGRSIFDIQAPDNIGAALRSIHTVCYDGIGGLIVGYMLIQTGQYKVVAVEAHSKLSNMLTPGYLVTHALDPVLNKPLGYNANYIAGMEMNRYLYDSGATREQCARVCVKNKMNAIDNPLASYGDRITVDDVLKSETTFYPLSRLDTAAPTDGSIVMVLASEEKAKVLAKKPVWIRGVGWCSDTPYLETRPWSEAAYARLSAEMAYKMASIKHPRKEIDIAEIDDSFSYKELQHMEALKLCHKGEAGSLVEEGATEREGELPINVSGGSLGVGWLGEATGLQRVLEIVLQLRGEAGKRQVPGITTGLAQSWRGVPTTTGTTIILSKE